MFFQYEKYTKFKGKAIGWEYHKKYLLKSVKSLLLNTNSTKLSVREAIKVAAALNKKLFLVTI